MSSASLVNPSLSVPVLAPLQGLYAAAGRPLPEWTGVLGNDVPEPYRTLLVHERDMTRTLEHFHRGRIHLRVLSSRREGDVYWRESVLEVDDPLRMAEYGAIQIFLDRFPEPWRSQILGEHLPLGGILNSSGMAYTSRPSAYFRCYPDAFISAALRLVGSPVLYGRRNTLSGGEGLPLAEIVEILPPKDGG